MNKKSIFNWLCRTLLGNILLFVILDLVFIYPYMTGVLYSEGNLTFSWAIYCFFMSLIIMSGMGAILWFLVTKSLLDSYGKDKNDHD